jgi:hypothetical protein
MIGFQLKKNNLKIIIWIVQFGLKKFLINIIIT